MSRSPLGCGLLLMGLLGGCASLMTPPPQQFPAAQIPTAQTISVSPGTPVSGAATPLETQPVPTGRAPAALALERPQAPLPAETDLSASGRPSTASEPISTEVKRPDFGLPSSAVSPRGNTATGNTEPLPPLAGVPFPLDPQATTPVEHERGAPKPVSRAPSGPSASSPAVAGSTASSATESETVVPFRIDDYRGKLKSSGERPIEMLATGVGSYRILIFGSIYGNEPESIQLIDDLAREARNFSGSPSYSWLLIRTPNPDGLAEHMLTNSNGVDLNRNFPSTWFTATPTRRTGPHPASEVETQHLMRLLKAFQPHRVVHVRSSIGQRPLVLVNDPLQQALPQLRQATHFDSGAYAGEYKAGSVEEFVTLRINTEMLTVLLPPRGFSQLTPQELIDLATNPFTLPTAETAAPPRPTPVLEQELAANAPSSGPDVPTPDGEKGFVEFLPPPPSALTSGTSTRSPITEDPKYYELPPPPQ